MTSWPDIDYGHTGLATAFGRGDVYGVQPDPARAGKRPLRIAIAGCGGVAQAKWLPAIRRLQTIGEPIAILGLVDPHAAHRDKMSRLAGAPAFVTLGALIDAGRPDLLLILAADAAHAPLAREAIKAGIACLIEKPLAPGAEAANAIVRLGEARGVLVASVANKRFSPPYATAKALVDQGALHAAPTIFTGKFTLGYPDADLLRGGTVHLLDLALWFMGPVARLSARGILDRGRLESAVISLAFRSGAIGTLMTSAAGLSFKPWERVEIFGANAFLVVDDQFELMLHDDETGPSKLWRPAIPNTLMFDESFGGYAGLLDHVLDAIRGLVPLSVPARDGAASVVLIEAIERAIATGADIDLEQEGLVP